MGEYSGICEMRGRAASGKGCTDPIKFASAPRHCALRQRRGSCTSSMTDIDALSGIGVGTLPTPTPTPTPVLPLAADLALAQQRTGFDFTATGRRTPLTKNPANTAMPTGSFIAGNLIRFTAGAVVNFSGWDFTGYCLYVDQGEVTVTDTLIANDFGPAVDVRGSAKATITYCDLSGLRATTHGSALLRAAGDSATVIARYNRMSQSGEDLVAVGSNLTLEYNLMWDMGYRTGGHCDGLQISTDPSAPHVSITIRNNMIDGTIQNAAPMNNALRLDAENGSTIDGVTVTGNVIISYNTDQQPLAAGRRLDTAPGVAARNYVITDNFIRFATAAANYPFETPTGTALWANNKRLDNLAAIAAPAGWTETAGGTSASRYSVAGTGMRFPNASVTLAASGALAGATNYALVRIPYYDNAPDYPTTEHIVAWPNWYDTGTTQTRMGVGNPVVFQSIVMRYSTDGGTTWSADAEPASASEAGMGTMGAGDVGYVSPPILLNVPANALIEFQLIMKQPIGVAIPRQPRAPITTGQVRGLAAGVAENVFALPDTGNDNTANSVFAKRFLRNAGSAGSGSFFPPAVRFSKGGDGRPAVGIFGDSGQGYGSDDFSLQGGYGLLPDLTPTGRIVFGAFDRAYDDNVETKRIATANYSVPGQAPIVAAQRMYDLINNVGAATDKSYFLQFLDSVKVQLGHVGFDIMHITHFANSANSGVYDDGSAVGEINRASTGVFNAVTYMAHLFNERYGAKIILNTSIFDITSGTGAATLFTQADGSDQIVSASGNYPNANSFASYVSGATASTTLPNRWRWIFDLTKFGSIVGAAPDAAARVRAAMPYVLDVSEPWFDEALDPKDVAKCDLIKPMLATEGGFNAPDGKGVLGTFAQTMAGAGTMWLSFRPRIGACLAWRADGDTGATYRGVYVRDVVAGSGANAGQYQVTYVVSGSFTGTTTTAGAAVAESPLAINGIHRSPASHMQRQRGATIRVKKRLSGMAI